MFLLGMALSVNKNVVEVGTMLDLIDKVIENHSGETE